MMYTITLDGTQGRNTTYRHSLKKMDCVNTSVTKIIQIIYRYLHTYVKDKQRTFNSCCEKVEIKSLRLLPSLHMGLTLKILLVSSSNFIFFLSLAVSFHWNIYQHCLLLREKTVTAWGANTRTKVYCIKVCICLLIFISSKLHSIQGHFCLLVLMKE